MLGKNIRAARAAKKLKQADLARRCGWSPLRMWRYESDRNVPGIDDLRLIARELGVTTDSLLAPEAKAS
jgi:transcriptional regulator with XRE-family HTH domain